MFFSVFIIYYFISLIHLERFCPFKTHLSLTVEGTRFPSPTLQDKSEAKGGLRGFFIPLCIPLSRMFSDYVLLHLTRVVEGLRYLLLLVTGVGLRVLILLLYSLTFS